MAQPVETTLSEVSVKTEDAAPSRSLFDITQKLTQAFPLLINSAQARLELIFASFAFANLVLFELFIRLPYAQTVAKDLRYTWSSVLGLISLALVYFGAKSVFVEAWRDLRSATVSVSVCMAMAVAINALLVGYGLVFDRQILSAQSLDQSLISFIFILCLLRGAEFSLVSRIVSECGFNFSRSLTKVRVLDVPKLVAPSDSPEENQDQIDNAGAVEHLLDLSQVKSGNIIRIRSTEYIPCDGTVVNGLAYIEERRLAGHAEPRIKQAGETVYAGSFVKHGALDVRATALGDDTFISTFSTQLNERIFKTSDALIEKHNSKQTIANIMVIALAFCGALFWTARSESIQTAMLVMTGILSVGLIPRFLQLEFFTKSLAETIGFRLGAIGRESNLVDLMSKARTLAIDFDSKDPPGKISVRALKLIDARVEEGSLAAVVFALAGRADSLEAKALSEMVVSRYPSINLLETTEFCDYPGRGLCGKVSGVDFSIGNEDFLLERGVLVQSSELQMTKGEELQWYVALNDEVIAHITFAIALTEDARRGVAELKKNNIRSVLLTREPQQNADEVGKRIGLELPDIFGAIPEDSACRKIESLKPVALLMNKQTSGDWAKSATVSLSQFDELFWDDKRGNVSLFVTGLEVVAKLFTLARRTLLIQKQNMLMGSILSAMLLLFVGAGLISPVICLTAVACSSLAMLLNTLRISQI